MKDPYWKDPYWKVIKKEDYAVTLGYILDPDDPTCWWIEAEVKWDGCTHMWENTREPFREGHDGRAAAYQEGEYQHICDLTGHIEMLKELAVAARANGYPEIGQWSGDE